MAAMITPDQYLEDELHREIRHELMDGEIYAMSDVSANHQRIVGNLCCEFGNHLKGKSSEPFGSNMKLRIGENFFYPDVLVDCDFDDSEPYFTTTPTIIVEVISRSTRKMDAQTKRLRYINIPSLQEYAMIEQDYVDVAIFRKSDQWRPTHYFLDEEVPFESIGCTLKVSEIYSRVKNDDMTRFLQEQKA